MSFREISSVNRNPTNEQKATLSETCGLLDEAHKHTLLLTVHPTSTVAAIFTEFYEQNDELITIYICDSSDGRQLTRQRKFNYWFYFFVKDDFVKYDDIIRNADGEKYPVALILKEQNPYKAQIIGEFIALISVYNSGK